MERNETEWNRSIRTNGMHGMKGMNATDGNDGMDGMNEHTHEHMQQLMSVNVLMDEGMHSWMS